MWQVNFNLANTLNNITIGNSGESEGFSKTRYNALLPESFKYLIFLNNMA